MAAHLRHGRAAAQTEATLTIPLTLRDGGALQAEKQPKIKQISQGKISLLLRLSNITLMPLNN